MFAAIVGVIVLMNLAVFAAMAIAEAMAGNWGPLVAMGQGFLWFVALIFVLSLPSLLMDGVRWMRRKRHGAVSPIIED